MNAIGMILKALGVNVTEESIRQLEALIPQLPGRTQQAVDVINHLVIDTHSRLEKIEQSAICLESRIVGLQMGVDELLCLNREEAHARGTNDANGGKRGRDASAATRAKPNGAG